MPRRLTFACTLIIGLLACTTSASAQTSAADQYLNGATELGVGGTAGPLTVAVTLNFGGRTPRLLRVQIAATLAQAGLAQQQTTSTQRDVKDFLASPLAEELAGAGAGPGAIGRAVARSILHPTAQTPRLMRALFGTQSVGATPTLAIFTRTAGVAGDARRFEDGIVRGLEDVPHGYAELSDADPSFVKQFMKLEVPTVDNLDTAAGRAAMIAILTAGAVGNFGTKATADSRLTSAGVKPLAVHVPVPGDSGPSLGALGAYVLLFAVIVGGLAWALPARRRRGVRVS